MRYYLTKAASNKKTGPMPVVTASRDTCPDSCAFKNNGCYAENFPLSAFWRKVSTGKIGVSFEQLLEQIKNLPRGIGWRWGQAGDLPGEGDRIDRDQLRALTKANAKRPVIAFTHKPVSDPDNLAALREANANGFHVNLSADGLEHADELARTGLSVVTVLPSEYHRRNHETVSEWRHRTHHLPKRTPEGRRVAICPATYTDVTCQSCMACARARPGGTVIGFPAHGVKKVKVDNKLETKCR